MEYKNLKIILTAVTMLMLSSSAVYAFVANAPAVANIDPALNALVEQAKQNNPLISAAQQRVKKAEAELSEAKANMGPKAGVAAGALWQKDAVSVTLPMVGSIPLISKNVYGTAVGFIQTIYAGGSLYAMQQASELALDAAKAEGSRVEQSVVNAVRTAYFNRRRAEEKEKVALEAVTLTKDHLGRAEKLFKSGVIAKSDVLRTKVAVAQSEMDHIKAANAVQITLSALERAVGAPIDPAKLENDKVRRVVKTLRNIRPQHDYIAEAYENRAELKMYDLLSRQAGKVARAAQGQQLPQIVGVGMYTNVDDTFFPSGKEEWRLGLAAYWTIFDSGRISAKTRQAKAQASELLYKLDDMKNVIKMEVTQAELNLRSAEARLIVAERRETEAKEDYRISVKRYEAGVGTNLDMLDARLALTSSRTELVDALYDIDIAWSDLVFAVGH
ncbi:MAG: TolC family protein [Synergistaceae bacterium]|nr:TolC family protein [Synergistaceae bacterium]